MEQQIIVGDLVRAKYAAPTCLFRVLDIEGLKARVRFEHKPANDSTFLLSLDLLIKA